MGHGYERHTLDMRERYIRLEISGPTRGERKDYCSQETVIKTADLGSRHISTSYVRTTSPSHVIYRVLRHRVM